MIQTHPPRSATPELVFVVLLIQAAAWLLPALAGLIFGAFTGGLGGVVYGLFTVGLAAGLLAAGSGVVRGKRWALWATITVEGLCVQGTLLVAIFSIDVVGGLMPLLLNLLLPLAVFWVLLRKLFSQRRSPS
jgi:hypothetical protein